MCYQTSGGRSPADSHHCSAAVAREDLASADELVMLEEEAWAEVSGMEPQSSVVSPSLDVWNSLGFLSSPEVSSSLDAFFDSCCCCGYEKRFRLCWSCLLAKVGYIWKI